MPRFALPLVTALILGLSFSAHAHRLWILPEATVLSAEAAWVTFDAAVSNDIFHTDYHALPADAIAATAPDGGSVALQNVATGKYRSTFDLHLAQEGTYRVGIAAQGLSARWEEDGERRFWPPRGGTYTPEGFERNVPSDADELEVRQFSRRIVTFVTAGLPSDEVLAPTNEGLELVPRTHPNDLFAGETATFRLLIDGEPAAGAGIEVVPGGMRYRNAQDAIVTTSDGDGTFTITWPQAGRYWLGAEYRDANAEAPASLRTGSYSATFEVLPQ